MAGISFSSPNILFRIVYLVLSSLLLVLHLLSLIAGVVMGFDGWPESGPFSTFCMVNVAHAFASGMGAGIMLSDLCEVHCDTGAVFAFFSASILFRERTCCGVLLLLVCILECLLSLHWWE